VAEAEKEVEYIDKASKEEIDNDLQALD